MTPDSVRVAKLQSYGLTENQAKAYLALLDLGQATASALNKVSGVPRNKVYSVVEELNEKGLVDIVLEDPTLFEPRPIGQYLEMMMNDLEGKKSALGRERVLLEEEFRVRAAPAEHDAQVGTFRIFKGRRAVLQQHGRMGRATTRVVRVLASPSSAARTLAAGSLGDYGDLSEESGIKVQIYTPLSRRNLDPVQRLHEKIGDVLRVCYDTPENVVIKAVDDREVMFTHFLPDSDSLVSGDDIGVWTDNPVFLQLAREIFTRAAASSQPFDSARQMLLSDATPPRLDVLHDPDALRLMLFERMSEVRVADLTVAASDLRLATRVMGEDDQAKVRGRLDRVRVITDASTTEIDAFDWGRAAEVRRLEPLPARFAVFDGRSVLRVYVMEGAAVPAIDNQAAVSVSTDLAAAVVEAQDHFERMWRVATPVLRAGIVQKAS